MHVDLVGPLPISSGFTYLFTVVDRTTRWPEAIPLAGISAAECAAALFSGWIQRFGLPAYITSDRGAQFTSSLWAALCDLLSITHITTTAYHPQSNGLVERFHRRLKDSLRARLAGADWQDHLPWVLLGIRSSVPLEGGLSPAEAVMGCQPLLPGQFLSVGEPPLDGFLEELHASSLKVPRPVSHKNTQLPTSLPAQLMAADFVLVRRDGVSPPLSQPYDGPYKVICRSLHSFQL
ncbi:MAG: DDE-type integrase/transposase/recombinase, partial [bacterium]